MQSASQNARSVHLFDHMAYSNFNGRVPPPPPPLPTLLSDSNPHYPAPPRPPPFAPHPPPAAPILDHLDDEDAITPIRDAPRPTKNSGRRSNRLSAVSSRPQSGASSQQPESPQGLADVDHFPLSPGVTRISSLGGGGGTNFGNFRPEQTRISIPRNSSGVQFEQGRNFANSQNSRRSFRNSNYNQNFSRPLHPSDNRRYQDQQHLYDDDEEEEGYNPLEDTDTDDEPQGVNDMRKARHYNVSKSSISNAAFYCLSASVYLGLVFALELRFEGQLVFLPTDPFRFPFFYCCVIAWALLVFGFFICITIRAIGRARGHVLSLPPNNRWVVVASLIWVSTGLLAAATASVFVFMGMHNRGIQISRGRDDPFRKWALPILAGLLSAIINAAMALSCFIGAGRATKSIKGPNSRSKSRSRSRSKSRSRDEVALPVAPEDSFASVPPGAYESWGRFQDGRPLPPSTSPPGRGTSGPLPPPRVNRQLSRTDIEVMLGKLREMGFPDERQNYEALYHSDFVISVAASRLAESHNYR